MEEKKKSVFIEWCNITSAHGFYDWANAASTYARIFWMCVITLMVTVATLQTIGLATNYFSYPYHTSSIRVIEANQADFPNVTICSYNKASKQKLENLNIKNYNAVLPILYQSFLERSAVDIGYLEELFPGYRDSYAKSWEEYQKSPNAIKDTKELYDAIAPDLESFLKFCIYGGTHFPCEQSTTFAYRSSYGRCFTISPPLFPGETKPIQRQPGVGNGMTLFIDPLVYDYPGVVLNNQLQSGIVIELHYDSVSPYILKPIGVGPGKSAWISMRRNERSYVKSRLHVFQEPCIQGNERNLSILDGKYSQANCIADCIYRVVNESVGCVPLSMVKKDIKICSPSNFIANQKALSKAITETKRDIQDECQEQCPYPCSPPTRSIEFSLSYVPFIAEPNKYEFNKLMDGFNDEESIQEDYSSLIGVDIFFEQLGYTRYEVDEKIRIVDLFSSIGGNLGLWLGVSVVTFIQMIASLGGGYFCQKKKKRTSKIVVMQQNKDLYF